MITNTLTAFPLQQINSHHGEMTAGQAFVLVLDGVTVVRRGIVVHVAVPHDLNPRCWLEGASQSARGGKKVDLFPPSHGVPVNLLPRTTVHPLVDTAFAAFVRLIPGSIKSMLPRHVNAAPCPPPNSSVVSSPFTAEAVKTPSSFVRRVDGKLTRVKREAAPCSPPSSIEDAPRQKRRYDHKKVTSEDRQNVDDLRAAIDILEERLQETTARLDETTGVWDAVVEKVADLSKQFCDHEGILIQKGFF